MATWNSRGLRGSLLEEIVNRTNEKYRQEKGGSRSRRIAVDGERRVLGAGRRVGGTGNGGHDYKHGKRVKQGGYGFALHTQGGGA